MPRDRYVAAAQFPVRKKVGEYRASARVPNVKGSFFGLYQDFSKFDSK